MVIETRAINYENYYKREIVISRGKIEIDNIWYGLTVESENELSIYVIDDYDVQYEYVSVEKPTNGNNDSNNNTEVPTDTSTQNPEGYNDNGDQIKTQDLQDCPVSGKAYDKNIFRMDDIAQIAPTWLQALIKADWGKRYGTPVDTHHIRKSKAKLEKLGQIIGEDGHQLLAAIYQEDTPIKIRITPTDSFI